MSYFMTHLVKLEQEEMAASLYLDQLKMLSENQIRLFKSSIHYQGSYGRMEIDGFAGVTRKYSTPKKKYSPILNFGNIQISDDHCRAYVQFYQALGDYYNEDWI